MWRLGWGRCFLPVGPKSCRGRRSWFAGRCSLLLQTYWCSRQGKARKVRNIPQYKTKKRQSWWTSAYLDGGDVEWCGDTKNGHYDSLILLVDEDLHVSDVLFSGHLRNILIGYVWFSCPKRGGKNKKNPWLQHLIRWKHLLRAAILTQSNETDLPSIFSTSLMSCDVVTLLFNVWCTTFTEAKHNFPSLSKDPSLNV